MYKYRVSLLEKKLTNKRENEREVNILAKIRN